MTTAISPAIQSYMTTNSVAVSAPAANAAPNVINFPVTTLPAPPPATQNIFTPSTNSDSKNLFGMSQKDTATLTALVSLATTALFFMFFRNRIDELTVIISKLVKRTNDLTDGADAVKKNTNNLENIFESYKNDDSVISFDKLPGMKKVKEFIKKSVLNRIEHPDLFEKEGVASNVGAIFYGLPGTGKTNIVKSLAKKIDAQVVQFTMASDGSPYVNQASINFSKKADEIIRIASENPGQRYFVLLDEVESFLTETESNRGADVARQELVKTTLQMLDKFKPHKNIHIFATTNTMLDTTTGKMGKMNEAALSRLGTKISVGNPDKESIVSALQLHLKTGTDPFAGKLLADKNEMGKFAQRLEELEYSYRDIEIIAGNAKQTAIDKQIDGERLNPKQIITEAIDAFEEIKNPKRAA